MGVGDRDAVVDADANRIQQVIHNLLSNAIKFTPTGKHVDLRAERHNGTLNIRGEDRRGERGPREGRDVHGDAADHHNHP